MGGFYWLFTKLMQYTYHYTKAGSCGVSGRSTANTTYSGYFNYLPIFFYAVRLFLLFYSGGNPVIARDRAVNNYSDNYDLRNS